MTTGEALEGLRLALVELRRAVSRALGEVLLEVAVRIASAIARAQAAKRSGWDGPPP